MIKNIKKKIKKTKYLNLLYFSYIYIVIPFLYFLIIPLVIFELSFNFAKLKKVFKNRILFLFWHHSFGHQFINYDWISKIYYPNKISLIEITHPRNNKYLGNCFLHNFDFFQIKSFFFNYKPHKILPLSHIWSVIAYKIIKILIELTKKKLDFEIIYTQDCYKSFSIKKKSLVHYDENIKKIIEYPYDITGYKNILNLNIGKKIQIPEKDFQYTKKKISQNFPKFKFDKFICILLRVPRGDDFYDSARGTNQENYINSISEWSKRGYSIVGIGETNCKIFKNIENFYDFQNLEINKDLLNIFLLSNCSIYIGQHSGALYIPNSLGIKSFVIDSFPFYIGSFNENDTILFKKVFKDGLELKTNEIMNKHRETIYGKGFIEKEYTLVNNSQNDIYRAFFGNKAVKVNFPEDTIINYQNNWIC